MVSADPEIGCSGTVAEVGQACAPAADREAILGMAGAFRVGFRFEETVACQEGYELKPVYAPSATEWVTVIADEAGFISLQHILVVENDEGEEHVIKHWRQDWRYEDTDVLAFRGRETWERESRDTADVRGTWTQAVYQTTDAPRYEAAGRWTHVGGVSTWESEPTWRPLPRREYTKRSDYDVVACRNVHTVTPSGWAHEQTNRKIVLDEAGNAAGVIAHEVGLNTYKRIDEVELAAAAAYWRENETAWAEIRAAWDGVLSRDRVHLVKRVDDTPIHKVVGPAVTDAAARSVLAERLAAYVDG